jgi:hypothetical protein
MKFTVDIGSKNTLVPLALHHRYVPGVGDFRQWHPGRRSGHPHKTQDISY